MYLSRVDLAPAAAERREIRTRLGSAYGIHQLLWELFSDSPERTRDFLFREELAGGGTTDESVFRAFTLSERLPLERSEFLTVETRVLDPVLASGDRLRFSVRVNPVIRHQDDPRKNKQRHDVIMDAKRRLESSNAPAPSLQELVQGASLEWLRKQSERCGFAFNFSEIAADGYRQHRFRKRGGTEVRLSTVDVEGILTVQDAERFRETWRSGLGPAKGFGCGLMLLRRA